MTAQLSRERREIIKQTANHIISREDTSEHSENLKAVAELALLALAGLDSNKNARIAESLESLMWPNIAIGNKVIIKAAIDALRAAPPAPVAVPDERAAFESFMAERFGDCIDRRQVKNGDGEYMAWDMQVAWIVWQRRAAMIKVGPVTAATVPDSLASSVKCYCQTCRPVTITDMRFVVCPDCGNKRCPRANDHRNACSGSNEPGQAGST